MLTVNIIIVFGTTAAILFVINQVTTDAKHYKRIESAVRWSMVVTFAALTVYCIELDVRNGFVDKLLNVTYP